MLLGSGQASTVRPRAAVARAVGSEKVGLFPVIVVWIVEHAVVRVNDGEDAFAKPVVGGVVVDALALLGGVKLTSGVSQVADVECGGADSRCVAAECFHARLGRLVETGHACPLPE